MMVGQNIKTQKLYKIELNWCPITKRNDDKRCWICIPNYLILVHSLIHLNGNQP